MKSFLIIFLFSLTYFHCHAQPGFLDKSFANDGVFTLDESTEDEIQDLAYLSDGSLIVAGYVLLNTNDYDGYLMRISSEGERLWSKTIDVYGSKNFDFFQGVTIIDDEIYVASNSRNSMTSNIDVIVMKYSQDGNLISSFGENGLAIASHPSGITGFEMSSDQDGNLFIPGRILNPATFSEKGCVIKFTNEGQLDITFGNSGISTQSVGSFRTGLLEGFNMGDNYYATGWFWDHGTAAGLDENGVVFKLDKEGNRVISFGVDGILKFDVTDGDIIDDIALYDAEHFLIAASSGVSDDDIYIQKFNLEGLLDVSFGDLGTIIIDLGEDDDAQEILVREDGGFYVCASVNDEEDFAIFSFDKDGSEDLNFGVNGRIIIDIEGNDNSSEGLLLIDGSIILGGESNDDVDPDFAIIKVEGYPTCSNSENTIELTGCGEVTYDDILYTESGDYTLSFTTDHGCDSLIHLAISIRESSAGTISRSACDSIEVNGLSYDTSGNYIQNLTNAQGCDSILSIEVLILEPTEAEISRTGCASVQLNGTTYDSSGIFFQIISNAQGCDSTITINVEIEILVAEIIASGSQLNSVSEASNYQWLDCSTNQLIADESSSSLDVSVSGNYALILSSEMCIDTSECIQIIISSSEDLEIDRHISLHPNPAADFVQVSGSTVGLKSMSLFDSVGRVYTVKSYNENSTIDLSNLPPGLYFLHLIFDGSEQEVRKLVVK